ncbi:amidohydrolase family protein [Paenibacillus tepidiphilus]|uniref:amidohydrolase family protein n=1 Tax=Paenibacillus tepidiphilus TaxID=2608683 RepID=UPI0012399807|nr:amidohydrolase [Paenibacillus tepidiphilus]
MKEQADILITNCSLMTPDFEIAEGQTVVIRDTRIVDIGPSETLNGKYEGKETLRGKGKLLMPGLVDAHTHTCQQFLRGRTLGEYPMIWSRILVPFESSLREEDVYLGAQVSCLEMMKSGTTTFAESGGVHMHKVAETVIESGLRAAITCSTMDIGPFIPDSMKAASPEDAAARIEELYRSYNGAGEGRLRIWFALRQVMTSTPALMSLMADKAREYGAGLHVHLAEHRDEVSYCLQHYQKRPAEVFDMFGALGPNMLAAHNVVLSEGEIALMKERGVKVVHCPRSNFGSHGFPKTPTMMQQGLSIGMGSDGAAGSSLSLFDEMRVFRSGLHAFWGLPIFDPVVIPAEELIRMATAGGAAALQIPDEIGTIEIGKKADLILIDTDQPHIWPNHRMIPTIVEAVNGSDVKDSIIDGAIVMKDRQILTMDEERILYESGKALPEVSVRAGI